MQLFDLSYHPHLTFLYMYILVFKVNALINPQQLPSCASRTLNLNRVYVLPGHRKPHKYWTIRIQHPQDQNAHNLQGPHCSSTISPTHKLTSLQAVWMGEHCLDPHSHLNLTCTLRSLSSIVPVLPTHSLSFYPSR
jgi:hypothetical protein